MGYKLHIQNNPAKLAATLFFGTEQFQVDLCKLIPRGLTFVAGTVFSYNARTTLLTYCRKASAYPHLDYYFITFLHELGHAQNSHLYAWKEKLFNWGFTRIHPRVWYERVAWKWALRTYRDLKSKGFPFTVSNKEMLLFVNKYSLGSYEKEAIALGTHAGYYRGTLSDLKFNMAGAPAIEFHD